MKVGILGGGQLGRMMALAGYPLALEFRSFDPAPGAPSGQLCEQIQAEFSDTAALERFCEGLDAVTYEWENVPVAAVRLVEKKVPFFYPTPAALEIAQDRLDQKNFLKKLGIPTAPFAKVDSLEELEAATRALGLPGVLKTRRMGYDGKGQFVLRQSADVARAWQELGGSALVYEGFIPFKRELSIVAARGRDGAVAFYPLSENRHREGILRVTIAPVSGLDPKLQAAAESHARAVLEAFRYVGVLTIEFFEHEGKLLVNELATRVHNSGHWTIEGAVTSQFENHLRAGLGLPLGSTALREPTVMVNLIGTAPDPKAVLALPGACLHLYGKSPKPGRKLGHVTAPAGLLEQLIKICGQ